MAFRADRERVFAAACRILVIAAAMLVGGCEKKADPAASARAFFEAIAAGKAQQAYEETAFGFQAGLNEKAFESVLHDLGLADYASFRTDPPKIEGSSATLHTEITTKSGKQLPLIVALTDESGAWRVFSIRSPRNPETGVAENHFAITGKFPLLPENEKLRPPIEDRARSPQQELESLKMAVAKVETRPTSTNASVQMPDDKEVRRLVRENLLAFDQAVADRSFKNFYQSLAESWKKQLTLEQLETAFRPFVEQQFRVTGIKDAEAAFDHPPALNGEGLLLATGVYPTQPYRVVFALKFYYEQPNWKLFGIDVNLLK